MPQKTKLSTKSCVYISLIALFAALLALFATFGSISSAVLVHHLKTNSSNKAEKPYYTDAQIEQLYQLTLNDDSQSYTISKYIGEQKKDIHVVIPAKYKNLPITQLGNDLFSEEDENYDPIFEVTSLTFEKNSNVKVIQENCFYATLIKTVTIPASVEIIEKDAFGETDLETVYFEPSSKLKEIKRYGFARSYNLHTVNLPEGLKIINPYAFECDDIINLVIPSTVTEIGEHAFYNCTKLESVKFAPNSQLTTIGNCCFQYATFTSIVFPEKLASLGSNCFCLSQNLETIEFTSPTPPSTPGLDDCSTVTKIYVPAESLEVYKTADGWIRYASKIHPSN